MAALNPTTLQTIGEMIRQAAEIDFEQTADNVRIMHETEQGSEILRLIVRDDLGGAADVVAASLWNEL